MRSPCISVRCTRAPPRRSVGDVAYGLVPLWSALTARSGRPGSRTTSSTGSATGMRPIVGVGPVATDLAGLADSRACVDRALRVLRGRQWRTPGGQAGRHPGRVTHARRCVTSPRPAETGRPVRSRADRVRPPARREAPRDPEGLVGRVRRRDRGRPRRVRPPQHVPLSAAAGRRGRPDQPGRPGCSASSRCSNCGCSAPTSIADARAFSLVRQASRTLGGQTC